MKDKFPGYYRPSEEEFAILWKECIFALDANVLLNLYRYPQTARDELLKIISRDPERFWIPHQAALEFQRNRLSVIAEQKNKFREVRKIVENARGTLFGGLESLQLRRRHSSITTDQLVAAVSAATDTFLNDLTTLEESQPAVFDDDPLRAQLDGIFGGRTGPGFRNQEEHDALCKEGESRFTACIPPGYRDEDKAKGPQAVFHHGGLTYQAKFGDLILWKQFLRHAQERQIASFVLVTDDEKSDWWWIVDAQGAKRIGPRPELVEEARSVGIERFYMYTSEQFLTFARKYLAADVSEESIRQVRDVARVSIGSEDLARLHRAADYAVGEWLKSEMSGSTVEANERGFPDFVVRREEGLPGVGYEVVFVRSHHTAVMRLRDRVYRASHHIQRGEFLRVYFVVVTVDPVTTEQAMAMLKRIVDFPSNVFAIGGVLSQEEESGGPYRFYLLEQGNLL